MDWAREPWVKVFQREPGRWALMSWEARGLYRLLQTEARRDAIVDHGGNGPLWASVVFRMPEAVAGAAVQELASNGFLVAANANQWKLPHHEQQQQASTTGAERVRRHRERKRAERNVTPLPVTTGVTIRSDQNRSDQIRSEERSRAREARVPADPKAAELATDLKENPAFANLDTASVAEALIGHLGAAAFNVTADKWRPAIAEAAVMVESGATEARRRQVLGWKFADLRDGRRRKAAPAVQRDPDLDSQIKEWMNAPKPDIPAIDEF